MFSNKKFTEFILNSMYAKTEHNYWMNTIPVFECLDPPARRLFFSEIRKRVMSQIKDVLDDIVNNGEEFSEIILRNLFIIAYKNVVYGVELLFEKIQRNYGPVGTQAHFHQEEE